MYGNIQDRLEALTKQQQMLITDLLYHTDNVIYAEKDTSQSKNVIRETMKALKSTNEELVSLRSFALHTNRKSWEQSKGVQVQQMLKRGIDAKAIERVTNDTNNSFTASLSRLKDKGVRDVLMFQDWCKKAFRHKPYTTMYPLQLPVKQSRNTGNNDQRGGADIPTRAKRRYTHIKDVLLAMYRKK
jgi:hypothetical protein